PAGGGAGAAGEPVAGADGPFRAAAASAGGEADAVRFARPGLRRRPLWLQGRHPAGPGVHAFLRPRLEQSGPRRLAAPVDALVLRARSRAPVPAVRAQCRPGRLLDPRGRRRSLRLPRAAGHARLGHSPRLPGREAGTGGIGLRRGPEAGQPGGCPGRRPLPQPLRVRPADAAGPSCPRRRGNCRPAAHARHPPAGRRGNGDEYPAGAGAPVHERVTLRPTDAAEAARVAMTYGPRGAEMDCTECGPRSTPGTSMRNAFRIALPGLLLLPAVALADEVPVIDGVISPGEWAAA